MAQHKLASKSYKDKVHKMLLDKYGVTVKFKNGKVEKRLPPWAKSFRGISGVSVMEKIAKVRLVLDSCKKMGVNMLSRRGGFKKFDTLKRECRVYFRAGRMTVPRATRHMALSHQASKKRVRFNLNPTVSSSFGKEFDWDGACGVDPDDPKSTDTLGCRNNDGSIACAGFGWPWGGKKEDKEMKTFRTPQSYPMGYFKEKKDRDSRYIPHKGFPGSPFPVSEPYRLKDPVYKKCFNECIIRNQKDFMRFKKDGFPGYINKNFDSDGKITASCKVHCDRSLQPGGRATEFYN